MQARAGALASAYTPDLPLVPAVRPEDMSKDPAAVQEYVNDPLVTVGPLRCRLGFETLGAFKELSKRRGELKVPHPQRRGLT